MDELLALCSDTLLIWLAGTPGASPLLVRARATRVMRAYVRELPRVYRDAICFRFGVDGDRLTDREIAKRLRMPIVDVEPLVAQALAELGWAVVCGGQQSARRLARLEVAA